jgi:hypothetical protein
MLTQAEADYLMDLEKQFVSDALLTFDAGSFRIVRELISLDGREEFLFDAQRGSLVLKKLTFQERARVIVPLVRLDIGVTLRHRNPNDTVVAGSHIHVYREGYDAKFAVPLAELSFHFRDLDNVVTTFEDFARYCHITRFPNIQEQLI